MSEENKNTEFDNSYTNNGEASSQPLQNSDFGDNSFAKEATPPPYKPATRHTAQISNIHHIRRTERRSPRRPRSPQRARKRVRR